MDANEDVLGAAVVIDDRQIRDDVRAVVDYNWNDERTDHDQQDSDGQQNHIFHALARLQRWLDQADRAPADRADEAGFRASVPQVIDRYEIVAVHGFVAGDRRHGTYARAVALSRYDAGRRGGEWVTHVLVQQDDRPDYPWVLETGHYTDNEWKARYELVTRHA